MGGKIADSTVSGASRTILPREICERPGLTAGDRLPSRIGRARIVIERATPGSGGDPFAELAGWTGPDDDDAFADP